MSLSLHTNLDDCVRVCVMRVSDFPTDFHQSFLPADKTLVDNHERKRLMNPIHSVAFTITNRLKNKPSSKQISSKVHTHIL